MEKRAVEMTKDLNIYKDPADLKKKHNCNQCNYSTALAGNLKRHKLVHSLLCAPSANILAQQLAT